MRTFYTYLWLREDGTPYYVGKGRGQRAWRKGSPHRDRVLVQEFPSEEDAFAAEIFLISYYGRKDLLDGCLINLTDGGEGTSGRKFSDEAIRKMSATRTGLRPTEATRQKMSVVKMGNQNLLGHKPTEETRRKISDAFKGRISPNKGKKASDETRQKMSAAQTRRQEREHCGCV